MRGRLILRFEIGLSGIYVAQRFIFIIKRTRCWTGFGGDFNTILMCDLTSLGVAKFTRGFVGWGQLQIIEERVLAALIGRTLVAEQFSQRYPRSEIRF